MRSFKAARNITDSCKHEMQSDVAPKRFAQYMFAESRASQHLCATALDRGHRRCEAGARRNERQPRREHSRDGRGDMISRRFRRGDDRAHELGHRKHPPLPQAPSRCSLIDEVCLLDVSTPCVGSTIVVLESRTPHRGAAGSPIEQ